VQKFVEKSVLERLLMLRCMQGNRREEDGFGWWPAMEFDVSSFEASGLSTRMQSSVITLPAKSHNPFESKTAIRIVERVEKLPPLSLIHDFTPAVCSDTTKLFE
jgi:hypothetical protein